MGDGNCGVYGLLDQLKYDPFWKNVEYNHFDLRKNIVKSVHRMIRNNNFVWHDDPLLPGEGTVEEWEEYMLGNHIFVDHIFMQLAAEYFERRIILFPVFPEDGESFEFVPSGALQSQTTLYLLFFSETRFIHGHYQSIRPRTENSSSGEPPEKARNDSETTVTLSDLSGRSDFEAISDINLPWARLISTSKCWNNVDITDDKWTFGKKASEEALNEKHIPPSIKRIIKLPFFHRANIQ